MCSSNWRRTRTGFSNPSPSSPTPRCSPPRTLRTSTEELELGPEATTTKTRRRSEVEVGTRQLRLARLLGAKEIVHNSGRGVVAARFHTKDDQIIAVRARRSST